MASMVLQRVFGLNYSGMGITHLVRGGVSRGQKGSSRMWKISYGFVTLDFYHQRKILVTTYIRTINSQSGDF